MIYLYVKIHNSTGLKYLGKTKNSDPHKYKGSGKLWKRHIKKHGYDVSTYILLSSEDANEIRKTGIFFSKLWNIVESDKWANLKPEEGDGGAILFEEGKHPSQIASAKGTHPWMGGEMQSRTNRERVANGTHHLLGGAQHKKRIEDGTHHLLGGAQQRKMVKDGTHGMLGKVTCIDKEGKRKLIDKEYYFSQKGPRESWDYVHIRTKEGKSRKVI